MKTALSIAKGSSSILLKWGIMKSRERIKRIIRGEAVDRCGFWLGKPQAATIEKINSAIKTGSLEEIQVQFNDDIRWITPQYITSTYIHPESKSMRPWKDANPHGLSKIGLLADCEDVSELDSIAFPESKYLDFTETIEELKKVGDSYRLSGFWSAFFHDLCYLFGTEEMLMLMLSDPEIIEEALERIGGFYLEANEKFFSQTRGLVDGLFIGNDFGMQEGLLFSPELFKRFFLPWIKAFAEQAHNYDLDFILHSCGGVADIIPDLIDAGVDCLHPFQINAKGMDIKTIAEKFANKITFMGGVDTQDLLVNGSTEDVNRVVNKLLEAFGNRYILGPSHEALLSNISVNNIVMLASHKRYI